MVEACTSIIPELATLQRTLFGLGFGLQGPMSEEAS